MDTGTKEKVSAKFAEKIIDTTTQCDQLGFVVDKSHLHDVIRFLRDEPSLSYKHLSDITATDWLDRAKRFEIVYHLYSLQLREYIRVKIQVGEDEPVPTMCTDWDCADWLEREVFDMFGVKFSGHPDLRRILMWDEFEGHPLRKDYPLTYEVPQFTFNKDEPPEVIK